MKPRRHAAMLGAMLLTLVPAGAAQAQEAPQVRVAGGTLRGSEADGVLVFKGIPYAAPPVGELRWRAPQPASAWDGARDATAYGADCMQNPIPGSAPAQPAREDCLYLNVWTPAERSDAPMPVMLWIQGGGFVSESGSNPQVNGAALAARGVVVVTFNYRLGRFGFFAHPALTAEAGDGEATGNWGLMDQLAAIRWVRANIAAFGGDPENITLFGESAGGESVARLMASPIAEGLFAKAIIASGGGRDAWPDLAEAEAKGVAFGARAGAGDLAALRALPAETVRGAINILNKEPATWSGPITDGVIVPGGAVARFGAGEQARVPLIVGANDDELGFIPAAFLGGMVAEGVAALGEGAAAVRDAYGSDAAFQRHFPSDVTFVEPSMAIARRHSASGAPTWLYRFGYVAQGKRKDGVGAVHASDVAFQFDTLPAADIAPVAADLAVADRIGDYWVNFARTGDPNAAGLPEWPAFSGASPSMLSIGDTIEAVPASDPVIDAPGAARDAAQ